METARPVCRRSVLPLLTAALLAAMLAACGGGQTSGGICVQDTDCPPGQLCRNGVCGGAAGSDGGLAAPDGGAVADGGTAADGGSVVDGGTVADGGGAVDGGDAGLPDGGGGSAFGERCSTGADCASQLCVATGAAGTSSLCTRLCSGDCPTDYVCKTLLNGNRVVNLCVPYADVYCVRCAASSECPQSGDACTDLGGASYCLRDCSNSGLCAAGYECRDIPSTLTPEGRPDAGSAAGDGGVSQLLRQCVPRSGKCPGCVDHDGDGYGVGADCLGPDCDDTNNAIHPGAAEVCDGVDNNCDGRIDEAFDLQTDNQHCGTCGHTCNAAAGERCCGGTCVDTFTNLSNCGTCGNACASTGADTCCGGTCRNTQTTPAHCGGCGLACTNANGELGCATGQCRPLCGVGYGDCDSNSRNGCETAITSVDHCGQCGRACTNANGSTRCIVDRCEPTCAGGFGDCDGNAQNGCETNVRFGSVPHCGACNQPCLNDHGTTACADGLCSPTCVGTWGNCDSNARNGCETDLLTTTAHCGQCGRVCSTANASAATCVAGGCHLTCLAGFYDCNQDPTDGCEATLATVDTCGPCQQDSNCPTDFFCRDPGAGAAKVCTKKKVLGTTCTVGPTTPTLGRECLSNNCVDGVCCDGACEGGCRSCNGTTTRGFCTLQAPGGTDPRGVCQVDTSNSCGRDAKCDGAGGCRLAPSTTTCQAQSCTSGVQSNTRACDGFGNCRTAVPPTTLCAPYACNGASCFASCDVANPVQCAAGYSCVGGLCKVSGGQPCTLGTQCGTGKCADGVCCDSTCLGTCERCDLAGSVGLCSPSPAGTDLDNECAAQSASTCGTTGYCDGARHCAKYPVGTECLGRSCNGTNQVNPSLCDGAGTCLPGSPAQTSCFPFACNTSNSACFGTCNSDAACAAGYGCLAGACKKLNGQACTAGTAAECKSGFCADGVCCDGLCNGTCEKCNQTGRLGFCDPVPDGQNPDTECPAQASSTCGRTGVCNGARACKLYPQTQGCAAAVCSVDLNSSTAARSCNGLGTCNTASALLCVGGLKCNSTTGLCRGTCGIDADCQSGYLCKTTSGQCLKADAQSCVGNADCLNGACCSGVCRNTKTDAANCGSCNTTCQTNTGTTANACTNSLCTPTCATGYKSCDGNVNNGCERNIRTLTDCGDCNVGCARANATASCATGTCALSTCNAGYGNCDNVASNGCEASFGTAPNACASATDLGSYCGDNTVANTFCLGTSTYVEYANRSGFTSAWFKGRALECSNCPADIYARVRLTVPAGSRYDLYVYSSCGVVWSSDTTANSSKSLELMVIDDFSNSLNNFDYWVEVRYVSGGACGLNWNVAFDGRNF